MITTNCHSLAELPACSDDHDSYCLGDSRTTHAGDKNYPKCKSKMYRTGNRLQTQGFHPAGYS